MAEHMFCLPNVHCIFVKSGALPRRHAITHACVRVSVQAAARSHPDLTKTSPPGARQKHQICTFKIVGLPNLKTAAHASAGNR